MRPEATTVAAARARRGGRTAARHPGCKSLSRPSAWKPITPHEAATMTPFLQKKSTANGAHAEASGDDAPERELLGPLLLEAGLLDQSQVEEAAREGQETGERLGEVVVRHGWASEDDVARVLAEQAGLEYLDRAS